MKTRIPITLAREQEPPAPDPVEQAGLLEDEDEDEPGSYLTYTATKVMENQAPKAVAMRPPMALTRKT